MISAHNADLARPQFGDNGTTGGGDRSPPGTLADRSGFAPFGEAHDEKVVRRQIVRARLQSLPPAPLVFVADAISVPGPIAGAGLPGLILAHSRRMPIFL